MTGNELSNNPVIPHDITLPARTGPTPSGVPVSITSPSSNVITLLTVDINRGTLKSIMFVLPLCFNSPSTCTDRCAGKFLQVVHRNV